jgi:hypothetical protein
MRLKTGFRYADTNRSRLENDRQKVATTLSQRSDKAMTKRAPSAVACLLAAFLLFGCGGGGGGDSASLYTGITSPATVTDNNAEEIALQSYQAGDLSSSTVSILGVSESGNSAVGSPKLLTLARMLKESADRMPVLSGTTVPLGSSTSAQPMATYDNTIYDGQGGSMTVHLSINEQTGEFSGTFRFNTMHGDGGELISGLASVSGSFDMTGGSFTRIRFSFNPVTMDDGTDIVSIYGRVELESDGFSASATMNIFLQDGNTLETVWISGYTMTLTDGPDADLDGEPDYVDATVTGKIYLPNFGCVVVTTPTPFRHYAGYSLPSSGVLLVTGSEGGSAKLVVNSDIPESPGYHVEADLDGIPGYEWIGIDRFWL